MITYTYDQQRKAIRQSIVDLKHEIVHTKNENLLYELEDRVNSLEQAQKTIEMFGALVAITKEIK